MGNSSAYSSNKANLAFTGVHNPQEHPNIPQQQQQQQPPQQPPQLHPHQQQHSHLPSQAHHQTKLPGITPPLFTPGGRRLPPLEPTSNPGTPTTNLWNSLLNASNNPTNPVAQQNGQFHLTQQNFSQFGSRKTGLTPNESNLRTGLTPGGFSFGFGGQVGTGLSTPSGLLNGPITPGLSSLLGIPSGNNNMLMGMSHAGAQNPGPSQMQHSQSNPTQLQPLPNTQSQMQMQVQVQAQPQPQPQPDPQSLPDPQAQSQPQAQPDPNLQSLHQELPVASPSMNNQQLSLLPPSIVPENQKFLPQSVAPVGIAPQGSITTRPDSQAHHVTHSESTSLLHSHHSSHHLSHNPSQEILPTTTNGPLPNSNGISTASGDTAESSSTSSKKRKGKSVGIKKPRATKAKKTGTVKVKEGPGQEKTLNGEEKENHVDENSNDGKGNNDESETKPATGKKRSAGVDDEKRKNFLERNRVAASKCRQRKKQLMQKMEDELAFYSNGYRQTSAQVIQLRDQLLKMKNILFDHKDCPTLALSCGGVENLTSIIEEVDNLMSNTEEAEEQVSSIPSTIPTTYH